VTVPPTTQSATPCAGETLSASAIKTIAVTPGSAANHIHLLRSSDVAANSSCHVGPSAFSAPAGTNVNLTGCLKDLYENPIPGARTIWTAVVLGTAFFVGTPESLSDANGQADAAIGSPKSAEGSNTSIQFCQDENADGACDGGTASTVNIAWGPPGTTPPSAGCNKIRGNGQNNLLVGTAGCDKIFARGGDDTSRGKAGDDKLNGGRGFDKARGGPGTDTCPRSENKKSC
jgi:hemolysin type calcium-binding protein